MPTTPSDFTSRIYDWHERITTSAQFCGERERERERDTHTHREKEGDEASVVSGKTGYLNLYELVWLGRTEQTVTVQNTETYVEIVSRIIYTSTNDHFAQ